MLINHIICAGFELCFQNTSNNKEACLILSHTDANLSAVNVIQDEIKLLCGLKGIMKAHQEGVFQALQQDIPLSHDVLLLEDTHTQE